MTKFTWRNRVLPRGVILATNSSGIKVFQVRLYINGKPEKRTMGPASPATLDLAIAKVNEYREKKRLGVLGLETKPERWTIEKASEVYWLLHGSQRRKKGGEINKKACGGFELQLKYIKAAWQGRMIDTITYLDVRDFRAKRLRDGVKASTVNRAHTVITNLFNQLRYWKRIGQPPVPKNLLLPEENPGELVKKADEHDFIRERLLTDKEYELLYMVADSRIRRIMVAEMNAPLRFEDLSQLTKDRVNGKLNEFKGIQNKTGQEYYIPISDPMWDLIRTAPGKQILDVRGFRKRWERAVKKAGLKGLQFRDLRRTAATTLHDHGQRLKTIAGMLGHSSTQTTERYLGLHAENLQEAAKVLGNKYAVPKIDRNRVETVPETDPKVSNSVSSETTNHTEN